MSTGIDEALEYCLFEGFANHTSRNVNPKSSALNVPGEASLLAAAQKSIGSQGEVRVQRGTKAG